MRDSFIELGAKDRMIGVFSLKLFSWAFRLATRNHDSLRPVMSLL